MSSTIRTIPAITRTCMLTMTQRSFRNTGTMGTLASQAEVCLWVLALGPRGTGCHPPEKKFEGIYAIACNAIGSIFGVLKYFSNGNGALPPVEMSAAITPIKKHCENFPTTHLISWTGLAIARRCRRRMLRCWSAVWCWKWEDQLWLERRQA